MLYVKGLIISGRMKKIEYVKNGQKNSFDEFRAWVVDPDNTESAPRMVRFGDKFSVGINDKINVPVRTQLWVDKRNSAHCDLVAVYQEK